MYDKHKLLVANRGEISVRILKTAKLLGIRTVSIYTPSDSLSLHVFNADESVPLPVLQNSEAAAYLSIKDIISIAIERSVTLIHPGYGFLSENAEFAEQVVRSGMIWLGPHPEAIRLMGIKHTAKSVAVNAGLNTIPGSEGLVGTEEEAVQLAHICGFPVILKATAGGGGMGMVVCNDADGLKRNFQVIRDRAQTLFHNDGVYLEKYFESARHIEIQVFGNGLGNAVHMRERECSAQRRNQKVIEETPSPFCMSHPGLRERMCEAAVNLTRSINYGSAGTVEFLVDEDTAKFYFLEMNTRIQVEHPITEEVHPGLDIVELMIKQGIAQSSGRTGGLPEQSLEMQQSTYDKLHFEGQRIGRSHSIEGRIYAENPYEGFVPSPGLLQYAFSSGANIEWLRIDSWIDTGITITPHFDPLLVKIIVTGSSRVEAVSRFAAGLDKFKVFSPPNNKHYLRSIVVEDDTFSRGLVTTKFLERFSVSPRAFKVLTSGIDTTIQDLPGRTTKLGIPRTGPMDELAFALGNFFVGNPKTTEGLEMIVVPNIGSSLQFHVGAVIAVTGREVTVKVNGVVTPMWTAVIVPQNGRVDIQAKTEETNGLRNYLCIRGGFPDIPLYLGSKSTSMGLGGYQGRSLMKGDFITLGNCSPTSDEEAKGFFPAALPQSLIPVYPKHWVVYVLPGPHDDEEFITIEGITKFYSTHWVVSPASNRLGIRLEAPTSSDKIQWARTSGGEGGSHPSNILDNGYAPGTINVNGDTPVILTNEGPDMGGYICMCTVATAEMWKLGQLSPGNTVQFRRITWQKSCELSNNYAKRFEKVQIDILHVEAPFHDAILLDDTPYSPILRICAETEGRPDLSVTFRQAGDSAILVEFGEMRLDILVRARIHAFQKNLEQSSHIGMKSLCPCIRSILCYFDPQSVDQQKFLKILVEAEQNVLNDITSVKFPGRRIVFPIVTDDKWCKEALQRYMATTRDKAVYLPSNIDYLARNNGLSGPEEAIQKLISSDFLVLGVGFYLACPFIVPIDPRCRLIGQKMNPSRTFTPRGAVGIAGPVAAIYPIESPGGYQLFGRTLPAWQTWGKGKDFSLDKPWLLEAFDQVRFTRVTELEYEKLEKQFDAGEYSFQIEHTVFSVDDHTRLIHSIEGEVELFRSRQINGSISEEVREKILLEEWEKQKKPTQANIPLMYSDDDVLVHEGSVAITSSLFGTLWKISCKLGDRIMSPTDVLVILESMKTEISIFAGEGNTGKVIRAYGKGMKEGSSVSPGDILVILQ